MNPRLIRAAIAFYPRAWRLRYGGELEQLILDACASSRSRLKRAWLITGVAACGIRERIPKPIAGNVWRVTLALATVGVVALGVFFASGGDRGGRPALIAPPTPMTLAPGFHIDSPISETHDMSLSGPGATRHPVISIDPSSGNVLAVLGAPASVRINPSTRQVVAVRQRSH